MPQVKDFNETFTFVNSVVNQNRAMKQLAHLRALPSGAAHARETGEQIYMVQQRGPELGGCVGIIVGDVSDDLGEVV